MEWMDRLEEKWVDFKNKPRPGLDKTGKTLKKFGGSMATLGRYLYKLRGFLLSIPVAAAAIVLSIIAKGRLPETVEVVLPQVNAQSPDAIFGFLTYTTEHISRGIATTAPLVLTIACLLLTISSKRMLYPWMISLLTLAIPLFLILTNVYI